MNEPMDQAAIPAAAERIAKAADRPAVTPEAEREKANAIIAGLAAERLLSPLVPTAFGGPGASILTTARAVAAVAKVSGSAGLIYAMHLAQVETLIAHGGNEHLRDFLRRLSERQLLVASATSEVGVGGNILKSLCAIEGEVGSRRLVKSCTNISYTDHAGAILATAMHTERGRAAQRLVLLEAADIGLQIDRESLFLGMRGIVNRALTIDARFPDAAIFPEPFSVIARTMSAASHVFWAAAWCGLAAAALAKAEAAIGTNAATEEAPRALRVAAATDRLHVMHALIRDACAALAAPTGSGSAFQAASRSNRLKLVAADLLTEIVQECALVVGFRGYVEGTRESLSEIVRDSMSARLMVSNDRLASNNMMLQKFVQDQI